jgi:hypothetical protein
MSKSKEQLIGLAQVTKQQVVAGTATARASEILGIAMAVLKYSCECEVV